MPHGPCIVGQTPDEWLKRRDRVPQSIKRRIKEQGAGSRQIGKRIQRVRGEEV